MAFSTSFHMIRLLNSVPTRYRTGPFRSLHARVSGLHVATEAQPDTSYIRVKWTDIAESRRLRPRQNPRDPRRTSNRGHPLLQAHHRSASASSAGTSHLRLLRVVIDHTKTVSGYEPADRADAVNGKGQRPVPPDDEAGRLQEAPLLLEECAGRRRNLRRVQSVGHREHELVALDGFPGVVEPIHGARHDGRAPRCELGERLLEVSQLLTAIRSPMSPVD